MVSYWLRKGVEATSQIRYFSNGICTELVLETNISTSVNDATWQLMPQYGFVSAALVVLILYLFVRHFIFVLMVADIFIGWLRTFRWFPGQGKRVKALVHWLIAIALFAAFPVASGQFGWIEFVPV